MFTVNENPQSVLTSFPINTMGLQTCMLPGLSWFQFARGGAIMAHNSYTMCIRSLPDMYTRSPRAAGPRLRVYISGKPLMPMGYNLGMGDTCKFHSIRFQVLSTKYRNHFDTILSTFDYHGYLLQIYQQLPEYDLVCECTLLLNPFCLITSK